VLKLTLLSPCLGGEGYSFPLAPLLLLFMSVLQRKLEQGGLEDYKDYQYTDHWTSLRKEHLKEYCEICERSCYEFVGNTLYLHHNTYFNLWAERPWDLHTLCWYCHAEVHLAVKRRLVHLQYAVSYVQGLHLKYKRRTENGRTYSYNY
jgi:hypothetical protein